MPPMRFTKAIGQEILYGASSELRSIIAKQRLARCIDPNDASLLLCEEDSVGNRVEEEPELFLEAFGKGGRGRGGGLLLGARERPSHSGSHASPPDFTENCFYLIRANTKVKAIVIVFEFEEDIVDNGVQLKGV